MKRNGNLYGQIFSYENLSKAADNAAKQKGQRRAVRSFLARREEMIKQLMETLESRSFKTSKYRSLTRFEPKRREISSVPFYPDQIMDHAIVQTLAPVWSPTFTIDTYACIPGRGLHKANAKIRRVLVDDPDGTRYCLLTDVRKFYASIDHETMKAILRRKIKCHGTLGLLDEIIDSHPGLPIGRYISPYLANLYLSAVDHRVKEVLKVKYYYRYNDNMVFLSGSKKELHRVLADLKRELGKLKLELNRSTQIFPVDKRGIDFTGYVYHRGYTRLRKSIKQRIFRHKELSEQSFAAYRGWLKWCNGINLTKKIKGKYKIKE